MSKSLIGITNEMLNEFCGCLCSIPKELSGQELIEECVRCKIGHFVNEIVSYPGEVEKKLREKADKNCGTEFANGVLSAIPYLKVGGK